MTDPEIYKREKGAYKNSGKWVPLFNLPILDKKYQKFQQITVTLLFVLFVCLFCFYFCFFFCIEYNIYPQITQHVCEVRLHFRCPDRCYSSILFGTASFDGSEINWCYLWYHIAEVKGSVIWSRGRTSNWN